LSFESANNSLRPGIPEITHPQLLPPRPSISGIASRRVLQHYTHNNFMMMLIQDKPWLLWERNYAALA